MASQNALTPRGAVAALVWAAIGVGGFVALVDEPRLATAAVTAAVVAYAVYLVRGGSVIFIPLPAFITIPLAGITGIRKLTRKTRSQTAAAGRPDQSSGRGRM